MNEETELNAVLDALVAALQPIPGLLVVPGMAYEVPALPLAYVMYEGERVIGGAQTEVTAYTFLVRLLLAWKDQVEVSERRLYQYRKPIRAALLGQDVFGGLGLFINPDTIRIDASERGDGMTTIYETSYRSAAIRFEVTE